MDYLTLRQIAKEIYELDTKTKQNFKDYYSEIVKRYKIVMDLLGLDKDMYKGEDTENYNIPIELKSILLFFLSELKSNKVLKNLTKQKRIENKNYETEDERIRYILRPDHRPNKDENIRDEFIKFIINTKLIDEDEKYDALLTLGLSNNKIYENTCMFLFEDLLNKVKLIDKATSYSEGMILVNLEERIKLVKRYYDKMDKLIEELNLAKEILDAENQDIICGIKDDIDIDEKIEYCIKEAEKEINSVQVNNKKISDK